MTFKRFACGTTGGRLTFPVKRPEGGNHPSCRCRAEDRTGREAAVAVASDLCQEATHHEHSG